MRDERLLLDQEVIVFRVVPGPRVIVAGKSPDCLDGVPQCRQDEVRDVALGSPKCQDPRDYQRLPSNRADPCALATRDMRLPWLSEPYHARFERS
jgi:hypothetical protein